MDKQLRTRVADDLRGVIRGELLFGDLACLLYSTDASIFQIEPLGVVAPRDEADVQAVIRYAAEHQLSVVPRGAGTGLAGESLGRGLILDLSRHFRQIVEVGTDTVRVQPGVVYRELNACLARVGRRFAPDPASGEVCTLGGMVATNASGARVLRHGYTRDHVAGLRIVLDNADVYNVGRLPLDAEQLEGTNRLQHIVGQVAAALRLHAEQIQTCRPRTPFNRCGYQLHDVLGPDFLDLSKLLVGSEGTLALFTEATLRTVPLPGGQSLVAVSYHSLEAALRAAQASMTTGPVSCDLIDRRLLTLIRGRRPDALGAIPAAAEALLLVEYEADTPGEAAATVAALAEQLDRADPVPLSVHTARTTEEAEPLWSIREAALPNLFGLRGGPQPVAAVEDVGVPPAELPTYLHRVQELLQRHEVTASFLIHAGSGQVHTRPFLDLRTPEGAGKLWALAEQIHELALSLGGTVSSQHGTGLARTPWVARQYGELSRVFEDIKAIFDPTGRFNPGKIVGLEAAFPAWPLRQFLWNGTSVRPRPEAQPASAEALLTRAEMATEPDSVQPLALHWRPEEVSQESYHCNGCGKCRTEVAGQRMCPIFHASHAEEATPRAKANLLRHLLLAEGVSRHLSSDEVRAVADLCVNCKMCALECPAHVNIPKLMLEAKAANAAEHGLSRADWLLARWERLAALGSLLSKPVNAALRSRTARWLLDKLFGISSCRRLPTFAARSFLHRAARRGWTQPPSPNREQVVYFVDAYANYHDPLVGEAVVAVLHHNGLEAHVPPGQVGSGIAPLAYGDVDLARDAARRNVRVLADLARRGHRIVCSEPSAALMLRHDYLDLLDDADARMVAARVVEFTAFVDELRLAGRLRTDFRPLDMVVGHHVPCHLKALRQAPAGPELLKLIPRLGVRTIDVHCSGMAGTFGLKSANYAVSVEAGKPMLRELARDEVRYGSTECGACRLQMEDLGGKRTLHPAQFLALAYGLLPEVRHQLERPLGRLVS